MHSIVTAKLEKNITGHQNYVNNLRLLEGSDIISCSNDKSIRIWNVENGGQKKIFNGHKDSVYDILKFNDEILLSASADKTIKIW